MPLLSPRAARSALLLLLTGRIAGVSGMVATATRMGAGGAPWSQATAFLVGLWMLARAAWDL